MLGLGGGCWRLFSSAIGGRIRLVGLVEFSTGSERDWVPGEVFVDVEAISPGEGFLEAITQILEAVDVVVAVIGTGWLDARNALGQRRIDDPSDFVRREVVVGLELGKRVVPVLVDGASMPHERDLPYEMRPLAHRNAVAISETRFDHDFGRLLDALGYGAIHPYELHARTHDLPCRLTTFVGRDDQLRDVRDRVRRYRLITLIGPGGTGKTRLALEVADMLSEEYRDGVRFVDLASVDAAAPVLAEVAAAVGIVEIPNSGVLDVLVTWLRNRSMLLVLDNCEHVLDAVATLTALMLQSTGEIQILATSRQSLGISGEHLIFWLPTRWARREEYPAVVQCLAVACR